MRPILSIGELLIDLIASDGGTGLEDASSLLIRPGGAPANVAVALSRLGLPSAFCGVIGVDAFGNRLRATLTANRVDTSRLRATDEADTTLAFAWKDERGDGHFRLLRMADRLLSVVDVERAGIEKCAAIVVGSVALAATPSRDAVVRAVEIAANSGVPVCFDVNLRPTLWPDAEKARESCAPVLDKTTLLKFSFDDLRFFLGFGDEPAGVLGEAIGMGAMFTVLTDGSRGAWFSDGTWEGTSHVAAFPVRAVEPTGAGDAFTAALISRLVTNDWSSLTRDDVAYASAAGALACTRPGAMEALPTETEIEAFMRDRPTAVM